MKRFFHFIAASMLVFILTACNNTLTGPESGNSALPTAENNRAVVDVSAQAAASSMKQTTAQSDAAPSSSKKIIVQAGGNTTIFELNGSRAAEELYSQLPLTLEVVDYGSNEKIFYPPERLDVADAVLAQAAAHAGTLAYYGSWGDVVMFYDSFNPSNGLYELGQAVSGAEHIAVMSGMIEIAPYRDNDDGQGGKTLLVYFSHTGTTADLANSIAQAADVDVFEIVPIEPYPADYGAHLAIARQEQDKDARPLINIDWEQLQLGQYDTILLGYPIWHGTIPMPVATFLEGGDFSGKQIAPFSTSGSTPIGRSEAHIAQLATGSELLPGLGITSSTMSNTDKLVREWIDALGIPVK